MRTNSILQLKCKSIYPSRNIKSHGNCQNHKQSQAESLEIKSARYQSLAISGIPFCWVLSPFVFFISCQSYGGGYLQWRTKKSRQKKDRKEEKKEQHHNPFVPSEKITNGAHICVSKIMKKKTKHSLFFISPRSGSCMPYADCQHLQQVKRTNYEISLFPAREKGVQSWTGKRLSFFSNSSSISLLPLLFL